jgi:uncharacterized membrane protein YphA (DoxX/SURF4 family)
MVTLKPLMKKFHLVAFSAVVALVFTVSAAITTHASAIYCLQNCDGDYGETFWLSCGSSAGNYFVLCPADGGTCSIVDERAQPEADYECARRAT